jgi:hypothetical protein
MFVALKNLHAKVDINRSCETIRGNINKIRAKRVRVIMN